MKAILTSRTFCEVLLHISSEDNTMQHLRATPGHWPCGKESEAPHGKCPDRSLRVLWQAECLNSQTVDFKYQCRRRCSEPVVGLRAEIHTLASVACQCTQLVS